jgi:hypothetical protein
VFVVDTLRIEYIEPRTSAATGHTWLTIHGDGFGKIDSHPAVLLGDTPCTNVQWQSDQTLRCFMQATHAGRLDVHVVVGTEQASAIGSFEALPPTITTVIPDQYPATGGEMLTINGASFGSYNVGAGQLSVMLGEYVCANSTWVSDSMVTCIVPAAIAGRADVVVNVQSNSATKKGGYFFLPPVVAHIEPNHLPGAGGGREITVQGANFGYSDHTPTVMLGATRCTNVKWLNNAQIECQAPLATAGAVMAAVIIGGNRGFRANSLDFSGPILTEVEPNHGCAMGGQMVDVRGEHFGYSDTAPTVLIGATLCMQTQWVSNELIRCRVPEGSAGAVSLQVMVGANEDKHDDLFALDAPVVDAVIPQQASAVGGERITIKGKAPPLVTRSLRSALML